MGVLHLNFWSFPDFQTLPQASYCHLWLTSTDLQVHEEVLRLLLAAAPRIPLLQVRGALVTILIASTSEDRLQCPHAVPLCCGPCSKVCGNG